MNQNKYLRYEDTPDVLSAVIRKEIHAIKDRELENIPKDVNDVNNDFKSSKRRKRKAIVRYLISRVRRGHLHN
jgi:hypothetical protein